MDYDYALLELKKAHKRRHMKLGISPAAKQLPGKRVQFSGFDNDRPVSWCTASARPRTKPTTSCTSAATLSQGPAAPGSTPACGTADAGAGSARSSGSSPDTSGWTTAGRLRSSTWRCASRRSNSPRSATGSKETTWTAEKAEHLLSLR